jgi:methionine aminopeptidase
MFIMGETSIAAKRLCSVTYEAMWHGIVQVRPGARLGDIGWAIQKFAEAQGFSRGARVLRPRHRQAPSTKNRRCCTTASPARWKSSSPA